MDDEDAEWEKFQKGLTKREKVLEGKSKLSHPVHCPLFTDDKQEFWWVYVCDRNNHKLITFPYQVSNPSQDRLIVSYLSDIWVRMSGGSWKVALCGNCSYW